MPESEHPLLNAGKETSTCSTLKTRTGPWEMMEQQVLVMTGTVVSVAQDCVCVCVCVCVYKLNPPL